MVVTVRGHGQGGRRRRRHARRPDRADGIRARSTGCDTGKPNFVHTFCPRAARRRQTPLAGELHLLQRQRRGGDGQGPGHARQGAAVQPGRHRDRGRCRPALAGQRAHRAEQQGQPGQAVRALTSAPRTSTNGGGAARDRRHARCSTTTRSGATCVRTGPNGTFATRRIRGRGAGSTSTPTTR